jgi:hypothetical protein
MVKTTIRCQTTTSCRLIQPGGQINFGKTEIDLGFVVKPFLKKYSAFQKSQITLDNSHPFPIEGRWPCHNVGEGCNGRGRLP